MLMLYDINAFKTDFSSMVAGVINPAKRPDTMEKSATTSRAGSMRMAPGRGSGHLCWWSLIFKKNFLISVLSDLPVLIAT
jgi:hypothetical protein